jgi:hypothetical protein
VPLPQNNKGTEISLLSDKGHPQDGKQEAAKPQRQLECTPQMTSALPSGGEVSDRAENPKDAAEGQASQTKKSLTHLQ